MTTITDLIKRLEEGEGADRELDLDIAIALGKVDKAVASYGPYLRRKERRRTDPFTASLDACRALQAEKLPDIESEHAHLDKKMKRIDMFGPGWCGVGNHPTSEPRARLIAILKAVEAGNG